MQVLAPISDIRASEAHPVGPAQHEQCIESSSHGVSFCYDRIMNKTVFITGGSSGIGEAVTQMLEGAGWRVVAPERGELDLANLDEVTSFLSSSLPVGGIDALVHIAGVWHDKDTVLAGKPFGGFAPEQIVGTMNVGLTSFMLLTNQLLAKGNLSQVIGISGTFENGGGGWLPYYTSKRALEDFLVGLSHDNTELAVYGISPADTATTAYKQFYPEYAQSAQSPEIVARLVLSLLSRTSSFKSGDIIELRDGKQKSGFHS